MSLNSEFKRNLLGVAVFSGLILTPALSSAASVDEIVQVVEQERAAGHVDASAYDEVILPLQGAKDAQGQGDAESYKSYLDAARLVITAASGDAVDDAAALRILSEMQP